MRLVSGVLTAAVVFLPCVLAAPLPLPVTSQLKSRQLLTTLSLSYAPLTPSIYLSTPSFLCPLVPLTLSGLYPPFALSAISSPFDPHDLASQGAYTIGNLSGSGEGVWDPHELAEERGRGPRFVVRVVDGRGNVRYSGEKVLVVGDGKHCRFAPLSFPLPSRRRKAENVDRKTTGIFTRPAGTSSPLPCEGSSSF